MCACARTLLHCLAADCSPVSVPIFVVVLSFWCWLVGYQEVAHTNAAAADALVEKGKHARALLQQLNNCHPVAAAAARGGT